MAIISVTEGYCLGLEVGSIIDNGNSIFGDISFCQTPFVSIPGII